MEPEFLTAIEAKMGLETPQAVLTWTFDPDLVNPLEDIPWLWTQMIIRKSLWRFPEDETDGDSVLTELYSDSPSTSFADTNLVAMRHYFFSLFLEYAEPSSSPLGPDVDIERLGTRLSGVLRDPLVALVSGIDGVSNGTAVFTSAGATFLTSGIQAGFYLEIDEGAADDGFYRILSVDSEVQITLEVALTLTVGTIDYRIHSDHHRYWISGYNFSKKQTLWRLDKRTSFVDETIDLDDILAHDEEVISILHVDSLIVRVLTNLRYVEFDRTTAPDTVLNEWAYTNLTPGYKVAGGFFDPSTFQLADSVYILDAVNFEIKVLAEADGSTTATIDLSGLNEIAEGTLRGLAPDFLNVEYAVGNRNYVYLIDETQAAPDPSDVSRITYSRQIINSDIAYFASEFDGSEDIILVDEGINKLQGYTVEVARGYLWQQPGVADESTIGLWHLDDATAVAPVDSSSYGNVGVNNNMTEEAVGRFTRGFLADAVTENISIITVSGEWDGAEGSVSIWFKVTDADDLTAGTSVLFDARADANNLVRIGIDAGSLTFEYIAGGTAETIQAVHPSPDTEFHNYIITWSKTDDEVKAFVDGVQFGATQGTLGVWAGVLATAVIGDTAAALLGVYDEVQISDIARTIHMTVTAMTEPNKMHAFSGRVYEATYESGDRLGFFYRDEIFTEKFAGGDFLIRNDYDKHQLHPQNDVIADSEIIFRGPTPLPELGDLGRLSRLIGLFLDRFADNREAITYLYDTSLIGIEDIPVLADMLGLPGLDTGRWNVDKQRRYLRVMPKITSEGGLPISYVNYARLLGFLIETSPLQARRRLDSVIYSAIVPEIQPIYLDEMGSLDTFDDSFPLALLRYQFYYRSIRSIVGATTAPNIFTDAGGTFRDTAEIGSVLKINDPTDTGDNGQYVVTEIHSDTELEVDSVFPVGGLATLTYTLNWEVPYPDPWIGYLLERFRDIAPDSMRVMHLLETV